MAEENSNTKNNQGQQTTSQNMAGDLPLSVNQIANEGISPDKANTVDAEFLQRPKTPAANQEQTYGKSELLNAYTILKDILGLSIGSVVADLGAGGGMFVIQAARLVGDQGQVYAVDILKNTLSEIESKARMSGLYNIKTVWSNLEMIGATKINEMSLDFALLVNTLFQSTKHYEIMAEASRLLKKNGKLLVIDWDNTKPAFTPPSNMQVSPSRLLEYAGQLELSLQKEFKAGQYHFGMIFVKN
ncbi:methyltransferase domain-containing protein [Candidatus Parcubacteria bacterium]|nr:MAG: methyltransferase domain-containing protein [Candidatus Parcubacteria bacterium]